MAYELERREDIGAEIKRIAVGQIDDALGALTRPPDDIDESVHQARQCFKRLRAVLALVRGEIGKSVYGGEDRCFRNAGRLLTEVRDATVLLETLDGLRRTFSEQLSLTAFRTIRRMLVRARNARLERAMGEGHSLRHAAKLVAVARERVPDWPIASSGFDALREGLERSYKAGRRGLATVTRKPSASNFHRWRKPVKVLYHELQILTPVWPEAIAPLAHSFHELSDRLNENHDLAVLRRVVFQPQIDAPPHELDALAALINERCRELEFVSVGLGSYLFSEKPAAFVDRIERYWEAWCAARDSAAEYTVAAGR